ncbi:MAG: hypothetical protein AAF498_16575 [Pseudomonadota bacterium]
MKAGSGFCDKNGHPLQEYDGVLLIESCLIKLSTGECLRVPEGTRATILFLISDHGHKCANLEVYPDETRFGFCDGVDTEKLVFLMTASEKYKDS